MALHTSGSTTIQSTTIMGARTLENGSAMSGSCSWNGGRRGLELEVACGFSWRR
jgi:hypothetical protein